MELPQEEQEKLSRSKASVCLVLWTLAIVGVFLLHYRTGMYHGPHDAQWSWHCLAFAVLPFGSAWMTGICLRYIWSRPITAVRKALLTLVALALAIPAIWGSGFIWLMMHMAP